MRVSGSFGSFTLASALAAAVFAFGARDVAAQSAVAPSVTARTSLITTRGVPDHVLLWVRNAGTAPATVRVVRAEYVAPDGPPLAIVNYRFVLGASSSRAVVVVPPGTDDALWLHFTYASTEPSDRRQEYVYRVFLEVDGRRSIVETTVQRATRRPWRVRP